jgi:hypothetical protein
LQIQEPEPTVIDNMREFGTFLAAVLHRVRPEHVESVKEATAHINENFGDLGRMTSEVSYNLLKSAGREATLAAQHMKLLSTTQHWDSSFNEPCYVALSVFSKYAEAIPVIEHLEKHAATGARAAIGRLIGVIPGVAPSLTQILLTSALGAGALGAGALWYANRGVQQEGGEGDELTAKINVYDAMAKELEGKLEDFYKKQEVGHE